MDKNYMVVLSRGFIGLATPGLNVEDNKRTVREKVIELRYNNTPKNENEEGQIFNVNIHHMHKALLEGTATRDKVVYNRAIIIEAMRAFGSGGNMGGWINMQRDSRYFTRNHQNFILDTLRFIRTGKRNTSIQTWDVSIKRRLIDDTESVVRHPTYDKEVTDFFQFVLADGRLIDGDLTKIIPMWLSHRNGADDLLQTLNIIFGKEFK